LDVFKPRGAQKPRSPVTNQQRNGEIVNTPRFAPLGGLSGPSKAGSKNNFAIKPPGDGKKII
jgi:hypothetical protein